MYLLGNTGLFDPLQSDDVNNNNDSSNNINNTNNTIALCTLDGSLKLMAFDTPIWELQVDHQLFALYALDITASAVSSNAALTRKKKSNSSNSNINESESDKNSNISNKTAITSWNHLVACAWDGMTYMIDGNRNAVRFQFDEDVCAFAAGYFAVEKGKNIPVLAYVTFTDQVYLYYNLGLESIQDQRLLEDILSREEDQTLMAMLSSANGSLEKLTRENCASVVSNCLYNFSIDELRHIYDDLKKPNA